MSAAHTVMFDTRRYFGIVVRDASGKRWSVREVEDLGHAHRKGGAA